MEGEACISPSSCFACYSESCSNISFNLSIMSSSLSSISDKSTTLVIRFPVPLHDGHEIDPLSWSLTQVVTDPLPPHCSQGTLISVAMSLCQKHTVAVRAVRASYTLNSRCGLNSIKHLVDNASIVVDTLCQGLAAASNCAMAND